MTKQNPDRGGADKSRLVTSWLRKSVISQVTGYVCCKLRCPTNPFGLFRSTEPGSYRTLTLVKMLYGSCQAVLTASCQGISDGIATSARIPIPVVVWAQHTECIGGVWLDGQQRPCVVSIRHTSERCSDTGEVYNDPVSSMEVCRSPGKRTSDTHHRGFGFDLGQLDEPDWMQILRIVKWPKYAL